MIHKVNKSGLCVEAVAVCFILAFLHFPSCTIPCGPPFFLSVGDPLWVWRNGRNEIDGSVE